MAILNYRRLNRDFGNNIIKINDRIRYIHPGFANWSSIGHNHILVFMGERIKRQNDESIYQPKIHSDRIKELFEIRELTGLPMTVLVDSAIREYVEKYQTGITKANHARLNPEDVDGFEDLSTY